MTEDNEPTLQDQLMSVLRTLREVKEALDIQMKRDEQRPSYCFEALMSLRDVESRLGTTIDKFFHRPLWRWLNGYPLTRTEFHQLVAWDLLHCSGVPVDDYSVFAHLRYEDEGRRCYIDPAAPMASGQGRGSSRVPPEEISFDRLRPEQREFFETYMPNVARRFKRHS